LSVIEAAPGRVDDVRSRNMPKYLMVINESEADFAEAGETAFGEVMQMHNDFAKAVAEAGAGILGGEALQPVATATFLRGTRTAEVTVVDNPLPDLKEVLGGYYLVEAADDAQALELAKLVPAPYGHVELRPIWEFDAS
jgi:hypothetical protein